MIPFNSGKFRALRFAQPGELAALREKMLANTDYLPKYHIVPQCGHLNDPNGMVFDGEKYHLFYQWYPFGPRHGMKHWKYLITRDFVHFEHGDVLEPDNEFETHGIYSGGAVLIDGDIYCFYSGNVQNPDGETYSQNQNVARYSTDGKLLDKWNIVPEAPEGYTGNFRDPSPFFADDGQLYFVIGAQTEAEQGVTLLYRMPSLQQAEFIGEVSYQGDNRWLTAEGVYMHECPELSQLGDKHLMLVSPMGLKPEGNQLNNIFSALYLLGDYRDGEMRIEQTDELDRGFDFYAPQTITQADRSIMLAWCGNGSLDIPTSEHDWKFMLTMPRELRLENGKLMQRPVTELQQLQQYSETLQGPGRFTTQTELSTSYLCLPELDSQPFTLRLFDDGEQELLLVYDGYRLSVDRSRTIETDDMQRFGSLRQVDVGALHRLDIYLDNSVVEIFINDGETVMTSRFFMQRKNSCLVLDAEVSVEVFSMGEINL